MNAATLRAVSAARFREQPGRLLVTLFAIALGVALATAVFVINAGALNEFGLATRKLVGEADVIVRGPRQGFDEALFVTLAQEPGVDVASPVLELELAPVGGQAPLKVVALDPFRAARIQVELVAGLAGGFLELLAPGTIALSVAAADDFGVGKGGFITVRDAAGTTRLEVVAILPQDSYPQRLGIMDIAAAQWSFDRVGRINRLDLRLASGIDLASFRERLAGLLPEGVTTVSPEIERDRAAAVTRAYRVNLNMLAMVALLTGAFLVFSTQALSILRRRVSLALLRALGVTRRELEGALLLEGVVIGALGSLAGVALGQWVADLALARLGGDLGGGYFEASTASAGAQPLAWLAFFLVGTAVAGLGAWAPAREAARTQPARALKAGDAEYAVAGLKPAWPGLALLAAGAAAAWLPAVGGLPLFGYLSVALLLAGGLMLVPVATARLLDMLPRPRRVTLATALAQLRGSAGQSAVSLAAIIVSFSLMVAMAVMVYSFRDSFGRWLDDLLPADVHVRVAASSDTAFWSEQDQARIAAVDGVARVRFQRMTPIYLAADERPVTLIARHIGIEDAGERLPLVRRSGSGLPADTVPVWVSEVLADRRGMDLGTRLVLPLAGQGYPATVVGVWRDYGRADGAIVVDRDWYAAVTGDRSASDGGIWVERGASVDAVVERIRAGFDHGQDLQVLSGSAIKELSLRIFDRAFAVTYALEAVAVVIGLVGVSFAFGSQALARRAEFGMLRHVGMRRGEVMTMLAGEGAVMGAIGAAYGLVLGMALSLVLVYVVNRQSFNWSIDLAVPWIELGGLGLLLVAAAGLTATLSGRAATSDAAVRAVREDW